MEPLLNPLPLSEASAAAAQGPPDPVRGRIAGLEPALRKLAGDRPLPLLLEFARAFHFGTPLGYFAGRSDESLAEELIQAFDFVDSRPKDEIRVRLVAAGGGRSHLQATMRDQPFLLDSAREALIAEGVFVHRYLHPILRTERDGAHRLSRVRTRPEPGTAESFLHFEIEPPPDPARSAAIEREVRDALHDAALAAEDFPQMRAAVEAVARALLAERPADPVFRGELEEAAEFLLWLGKGNFIFLAYRSYDFEEKGGSWQAVVTPRSGLGILRDPASSAFKSPVPFESLEPALQKRMLRKIFPLVSKTNRESRVHRRARMDYIGIKKLARSGEVVGEHRILGFFTSQSLNQMGSEIPVLRRKLAHILARAQVLEGSHDYKEIVGVFNGLPKAELLATDEEEIARTIEAVMNMQSLQGIRVTCRRDNLGRGVSAMVILPRDRFNSDVRRRIQAAFATRFGGPPADYRLALGEEQFARLHFYFPVTPGSPLPPAEALERDVERAIRTWDDGLREELSSRMGQERGGDLARRYAGSLPSTYRTIFDPAHAVDDLPVFEDLRSAGGVRVRITRGPRRGEESTTLLRLYRARAKFYLSEVMPILTNLGLQVIDELTFRVEGPPQVVYLHTIRLQAAAKAGAPRAVAEERWPALGEAILALLEGRYENDGLGALVLSGLTIPQVDLLRSYLHFFRQLRVPYTRASVIAALQNSPAIAAKLVAHFESKFRPEAGVDPRRAAERRAESLARSREEILKLLEGVEEINQDRILRGLLELMEATVRTSYFQRGGLLGRLSLKFQSGLISFMPRPVPLYEIYVHNVEMEGVHLRSAKVARGGIRWSDRRDDFRTEVLGLMRTQLVKNAVIVPMGSKGGFVLKKSPDSRDELQAQVARQYKTLISGMLDLTDNLAGGKLIHPQETVIYDGPDPYLVVAADKGTATFSDLANSIAAEYGFWLGDGFASGGSHGYDHKKEGITARGAWECVKNHLYELGIDPEGEITVAGIGDMSGDVFGNGLLLSSRFKLLAAFDHRHIFLDPTPDPAASYQERRRLFELPGSSWADYDQARTSSGGGVFRRDQKRIVLTPQLQTLLTTTAEALNGEELVREVLKLPVDLFWNGGIGTYVKASSESHAEVGDSRNDSARIDAAELRARVVAEGGNLGFTQAARVEYALRGGKINTDFIDNSAGVDLSDHEVNIKIALADPARTGRLDPAGRDRLLLEMKDEVCQLVLVDNRRHAQVLSLEESVARQDLHDTVALAQELGEAGLLEAKFERFPEAAELKRRAERKVGLVRPELAILLAFTKIELSRTLRESSLVDSPGFEGYLPGYFPEPLRERFPQLLQAHPLRREIAVSRLVNELVYRLGVTFVSRFRRELGVQVEDVVRAYRAADLLLGGEAFVEPVRDLLSAGKVSAPLGYELLFTYRLACDELVNWLLRTWPVQKEGVAATAASVLKKLKPAFSRTSAWLAGSAPGRVRERTRAREAELTGRGAPAELAARAAALELERHLLPVVAASRQAVADPERAALAYLSLRGALRLGELESAASQIPAPEPDDRSALRALLSESRLLLVDLTSLVLAAAGSGDPEGAADEFLAARGQSLNSYLRALPAAGRPFSLGSLLVAIERLRRLALR
jgi:glutamate dehydrogenase